MIDLDEYDGCCSCGCEEGTKCPVCSRVLYEGSDHPSYCKRCDKMYSECDDCGKLMEFMGWSDGEEFYPPPFDTAECDFDKDNGNRYVMYPQVRFYWSCTCGRKNYCDGD